MSGETKSLGQKDFADRFYTKDEIAQECVNFFYEKVRIDKSILFIEPSAGAGAFLPYLKNYKAFDILPANENIIQANWLSLDKSNLNQDGSIIVVIGNPPFGVQNNLAIKFFNSSVFADYIAFILPKSFKKTSIQNQLDLNFKLIAEKDIPSKSFLLNGESYGVNCVFQIWKKSKEKRKIVRGKTTTKYFDFTKDKNKATCSLRRVGAAAGNASFELSFSEQSNYFLINRTELNDEEFVNFLNSLAHKRAENAVGPKSLSKSELIEDFEIAFKDKFEN